MSADEDITVCPICFEKFNYDVNTPRLLPCSHTLCHLCIEKLITSTKQVLQCPQCRQRHNVHRNGPKTFPQNKYILHIISLKIEKQDKHKHDTLEPGLQKCREHNRELGLFCLEACCQTAICLKCFTSKHLGHETIDIELKIKTDIHGAIDDTIAMIETLKNAFSKSTKEVSKMTARHIIHLMAIENECVEDISQTFKEHENRLLTQEKKLNDNDICLLEKDETLLKELKMQILLTKNGCVSDNFSTHMELIKGVENQIDCQMTKTPHLVKLSYLPTSEQDQKEILKNIFGEFVESESDRCIENQGSGNIVFNFKQPFM